MAVVELDAGCRVVGRLEGDAVVEAEQPVEGVYLDHGDWTELRFRAT